MKLGFTRFVSISDAIWYLRRIWIIKIGLINAVQPNLRRILPITPSLTRLGRRSACPNDELYELYELYCQTTQA